MGVTEKTGFPRWRLLANRVSFACKVAHTRYCAGTRALCGGEFALPTPPTSVPNPVWLWAVWLTQASIGKVLGTQPQPWLPHTLVHF